MEAIAPIFMDDLRLSYSHWGMQFCYTYPLAALPSEPPVYGYQTYPSATGWPMMYCGDSYDAKYLHG